MAKGKIQNFKIEEDVKIEFAETCDKMFTTPAHELRLFVRKYIKAHGANAISLSNFRKRTK